MKRLSLIALLGMLAGFYACRSVTEVEVPDENIHDGKMVIEATHEFDSLTRTVLQEDGSVWWSPNDAVGIFFGEYMGLYFSINSVDAPTALFVSYSDAFDRYMQSPDSKPGADSYWGVYSHYVNYGSADTRPTREKESVNVSLPSSQKAVAGTFDSRHFISIAKSNNHQEFTFYNLCGGLAFCVEKEGITKVTFQGNAGETLAGRVNVVMDSEGHPVVNEARVSDTKIVMEMPAGEYFVPGEMYYMIMLPTVLSEGYTMIFQTDLEEGTLVSSDPVEIKRSTFGRLTDPDSSAEWVEHIWTTATCDPQANLTALKTLKVSAKSEAIHICMELEEGVAAEAFNIMLDADCSAETGGGNGSFTESTCEWMIEGVLTAEEIYVDPGLYIWTGEVGDISWSWDGYLDGGFASVRGNGNQYNIVVTKEHCPDIEWADTFGLGVIVYDSNWYKIGCLPNAASTDDNLAGCAPLLRVTFQE